MFLGLGKGLLISAKVCYGLYEIDECMMVAKRKFDCSYELLENPMLNFSGDNVFSMINALICLMIRI